MSVLNSCYRLLFASLLGMLGTALPGQAWGQTEDWWTQAPIVHSPVEVHLPAPTAQRVWQVPNPSLRDESVPVQQNIVHQNPVQHRTVQHRTVQHRAVNQPVRSLPVQAEAIAKTAPVYAEFAHDVPPYVSTTRSPANRVSKVNQPIAPAVGPVRQVVKVTAGDDRYGNRYLDGRYRVRSIVEEAPMIAKRNREYASTVPDWLAKVFNTNAGLADQLIRLNASRYDLQSRLTRAQENLSDIRTDFQAVSAKLHEYGLTPTIGLLLRHRQQQLDTWQTQDNETHYARAELGKAQRSELQLELIASDADPIEHQADELLWDAGLFEGHSDRAVRRQQVLDLLSERSQLLAQLHADYRQYHRDLDVLDSTASATIAMTVDYRKLIRKHVTWIRSGEPIGFADVRNTKRAIGELFEFRHTRQFGRDLSEKLATDQSSGVLLMGLLVALILIRWRLKSWLVSIGSKKRLASAGRMRMVAAGLLTIALASMIPLLGYAVGWWLRRGIVTETLLHVADALFAVSLISLLIEVPRQMLRPYGLADKHLAKSISSRAQSFKGLSVAGVLLVPGAFAVTLFRLLDHGIWHDSLGRLTFMTLMLGLACWGHFALRPRKGFLCPVIRAFGGRLATGFGHLWYAIAIGFPVTMGILSAMGFDYTSSELIKRATLSIILVLVTGVAWTIARVSFAQIWLRLTQEKVEPRYDEYGLIEDETLVEEVDQTHMLLKHQLGFLGQCLGGAAIVAAFVGLWLDVVPRVDLANPVLWNVQDTVTSYASDADGNTVASSVVETSPVTLLNLLASGAILFFTIQLSRLLPNLFDALVLQRVDYDEGMEHLVLVVGRCIVFSVGCFLSCRLVGMRWSTIQWLMVGITVGLGFGLQDFVRNLLGGFVVLFARPVNVGDRVTVGRVTGRIASQTLRMTTLSDDQGRQLQIPNRKFLSEDVTNWRGAGKLTTVPIEVNVSREERPIDVGRMMMEWASEQPHVLQSPQPQVTLVCVAKQTQRFELHVWIEDENVSREVQNGLLKTVRKNLRERKLLAKEQPSQPSIQRANPELHPSSRTQKRRSA